ncbi:hypothetical protein QQ045_001678 [Rhodiola kirilowii]
MLIEARGWARFRASLVLHRRRKAEIKQRDSTPTRLYKGIIPLWGRQNPYTMMKFASFETIVEMLYKHVVPTAKDQCSKSLQLGVSFAGGGVDAETSEEDDIGRSSSSLGIEAKVKKGDEEEESVCIYVLKRASYV